MKTHTWQFCTTCLGYTVLCRTCGNNQCNGGSGIMLDGTKCKDCDDAYEFQNKDRSKWRYLVNKFFSYYYVKQLHLLIFGHPLDRLFKELEKKKDKNV